MNKHLTITSWISWMIGAFLWWAVCGGTPKEAGWDAIHATMVIGGLWVAHKVRSP
jgi:hypothetical protein